MSGAFPQPRVSTRCHQLQRSSFQLQLSVHSAGNDLLPSWNDGARRSPSSISSPRSPRRARPTSCRPRTHRHLRQRRHAVVRAADVRPARLRARPRQGAGAAASRMEGQAAVQGGARRRHEGRSPGPARRGLVELIMATHAGMTTDEFEKIVTDWLATARASEVQAAVHRARLPADARTARLSARERLQDLHRLRRRRRVHAAVDGEGLRHSARAGGRAQRSRPSSRCATASRRCCACRRSTSSTTRPASPSASMSTSAGGPIAAFGNSDGDLEMLQWTTMAGSGAALRPHRPPHRRRARVRLRSQVPFWSPE